MLETLRRIVQEVTAATDLSVALETLVMRIKEAMGTQVCSIYLLDEHSRRYILLATEGLNKKAIGKVSLGLTEGLIGQVGLREEPINLEAAAKHPKYHYLAETGEERFNAFLGVPIIHNKALLGVLVIQQQENRQFDQSEEAFLVTLSAQLAGVVAHAKATGAISSLDSPGVSTHTAVFKGIIGSNGAAIGTGVVVYPPADLNSVPDKKVDDIPAEISRMESALISVREEVRQLARRVEDTLGPEEQALFDVYLRMLDKRALGGELVDTVREGYWAQSALRRVIKQHVRNFERMDDPYLRERAADVRDLGLRVLAQLQRNYKQRTEYPDKVVLVGDEITTAMLIEIPEDRVVGIASVKGSSNSHMAIVARALGIPTVVGALDLPVTLLEGNELIIDGFRGRIISNATSELRKQYQSIIEEEKLLVAGLEPQRDLPSVTLDNHSVPLYVNTGLMADFQRSLERGAEGVGLYRTEIPFMVRERFPSEEEQRLIYRGQLEVFSPRPVTMRTLDIGGDKALPYFPIEEENPFLGWRGIRITLDHPEIFMQQARAMLKASAGLSNLRVLLPMVTTVAEVEESMYLLHRAYLEVKEEGFDVLMPPLGVMIEVPAAIYQIKEMASLVDFISVGSNDLTQYLLAVDRNNPRVSDLYSSFHPAVLGALKHIADEAHAANVPISICGEMAGDPGAAMLLMAMGYDTLSMNASHLLKIKSTIRISSMSFAKNLLDDVLKMDNAEIIKSHINLQMKKNGLNILTPKMV